MQDERMKAINSRLVRTIFFLVLVDVTACGSSKGDGEKESSTNYPAYADTSASGTIKSVAATFSTGYVVNSSAKENGKVIFIAAAYFFTDSSTKICPSTRIPV